MPGDAVRFSDAGFGAQEIQSMPVSQSDQNYFEEIISEPDLIADPWNSIYPEASAMAYRSPQERDWPDSFHINDLNALISLCGAKGLLLTMEAGQFSAQEHEECLILSVEMM